MKLIHATWSAPANVHAVTSTREGGVSLPPFDQLNVGDHVSDDPVAVAANRARLLDTLGVPHHAQWLSQVHGTKLVKAQPKGEVLTADACWTDEPLQACVVMTADCLPVCFTDGRKVAVAHAGWRGLVQGVLEQTLTVFDDLTQVHVWLGPAIGPQAFEVGAEVKAEFEAACQKTEHLDAISAAFVAQPEANKWLADLYQLARVRLHAAGVNNVSGGDYCTFTDSQFYSYRREPMTGRLATVIWLSDR